MKNTAKGPLVLLFYDGFEWRARSGRWGSAMAQARRFARFAYRTARRQQVRTGFYTAFLALRRALEQEGCDVRVNDFRTAAAMPDYPIGIAGYPSVLDAIQLSNPKVFGPGDFGTTADAVTVAADPTMRFLIQPSDWFSDYYRPSCGEKIVTWFAGIDLDRWADSRSADKSIDVLIYDKIRWDRDIQGPAVIDRLKAHLDKRGLRHETLRYGHHHQASFARMVAGARSMAFVCEHETQGLAYQEALAVNVPVFAWDEGVFVDPLLNAAATPDLAVTSVPYFDERCGSRFRIDGLEQAFTRFWNMLPDFEPRAYVADCLSMRKSAEAYLQIYQTAAG